MVDEEGEEMVLMGLIVMRKLTWYNVECAGRDGDGVGKVNGHFWGGWWVRNRCAEICTPSRDVPIVAISEKNTARGLNL